MGPVDFVRGMEEALIRLCDVYGVKAGRIAGLTGVWVGTDGDSGPARKIGAIGIHVSRGIVSHGFAFNVRTDLKDFQLINPCGITDKPVTSLELEPPAVGLAKPAALPGLEAIAHEAARLFGEVFRLPVEQVASVDALRKAADVKFPAEDRPVEVPREVERLRGDAERPVRA